MASTTQIKINTSGTINDGYVVQIINDVAVAATINTQTPFHGIATQATTAGQSNIIQTQGPLSSEIAYLGDGYACAVGLNSIGQPVRATDPTCKTAPNWIGYCDADGYIFVQPKRADYLNVLDFGAKADADGAGSGTDLGFVLNFLQSLGTGTNGVEIYIPSGKYRLATPVVLNQCVKIRGAGGSVFEAPAQIFVAPGVSGFTVPLLHSGPYAGANQGCRFSDFWIGAESNLATSTTASWTQSTKTAVVASIQDFIVGQIICLHGIGGQTPIPYLYGTSTGSSSNQITLTGINAGYGLKIGHFIICGAAYPTATQITNITGGTTLTMASNASAPVTNIPIQYCFDLIGRIESIVGTSVVLDVDNAHIGSAGLPGSPGPPTSATNVPVTHADTAFYMNTTFSADNIYIGAGSTSGTLGFAGAGWTIVGYTAGSPASNTDLAFIHAGYILHCKHAIYTLGDACNVIRFIGVTASSNIDWSFCETAFLGNTFVGCHADGGFGFITTYSSANASVFTGCYMEGGTIGALGEGCLWLGGVASRDQGGTSIVGGVTNSSYYISNDQTASVYINVADFNNSTSDFIHFFTPGSVNSAWTLSSSSTNFGDELNDWFGLRQATGVRSWAWLVPDINSPYWVPGAPPVWFPGGLLIGGPNEGPSGQRVLNNAAAAPTSGTWHQGDIFFNNAPVIDGYIGWVCTTAGTPGTWTQFGSIGPVTNTIASTTTNYNILSTDNIVSVGTLSGPITITLESAPVTGRTVTIKDANGSASNNNITISGNGHNIDNNTTFVISQAFGTVELAFNGSTWMVL